MARTKDKEMSTSGYFRKVFDENENWLDSKNNEEVIERWKQDHAGQEFTPNIRGIMNNQKSKMNKARGKGRRRRKRRKAEVGAGAEMAAPRLSRSRSSTNALENLELLIDQCLAMARQQEEGFEAVVKNLRDARNAVVYKLAHPSEG